MFAEPKFCQNLTKTKSTRLCQKNIQEPIRGSYKQDSHCLGNNWATADWTESRALALGHRLQVPETLYTIKARAVKKVAPGQRLPDVRC